MAQRRRLIYRKRAEAAHAEALQDGSTPKRSKKPGRCRPRPIPRCIPATGTWHLVYENLAGSDALYQSEPIARAEWQANQWQRLREERVKAVAQCTEQLAATPEKFW